MFFNVVTFPSVSKYRNDFPKSHNSLSNFSLDGFAHWSNQEKTASWLNSEVAKENMFGNEAVIEKHTYLSGRDDKEDKESEEAED